MRLFWLLAGFYRVPWRALTIRLSVLYAQWVRAVWGGDDAVLLIGRARKHAVIPLLRGLGGQVAPDADIETQLVFHNVGTGLGRLTIGEACHVGKRVFFDLSAPIRLEARVTLSMGVSLLTHIDVGRSRLGRRAYPPEHAGIVIAEDAYVGANATILHGVRVGRAAVVAAGALVTDDVPDLTVVGGVPARVIKTIDPALLMDVDISATHA